MSQAIQIKQPNLSDLKLFISKEEGVCRISQLEKGITVQKKTAKILAGHLLDFAKEGKQP